MADPTHGFKSLDPLSFCGLDDGPLAVLADRLGGVQTAVAGLECGTLICVPALLYPTFPAPSPQD